MMRDAGSEEQQSKDAGQGYQFGTFKGVFTPSILTIFGVVMYLRFGWVLGNVGLPKTLMIVTMATSITFLTALSLSALATNMKVGAGGAYYIISRSLGLEPGAAVGLPLFFAQALGISFYISGFAESIVKIYPGYDLKVVGIVTLLVLTVVAYISANLALKAQLLVMAVVAVSLVSFFTGGASPALELPADVVAEPKWPFWAVFAVFFPAVTGIEAGISMSGDLKNPARSLPLGTMAAVLTGYIAYLVIPVFLWFVVTDDRILVENSMVMRDIARWPNLILYGLWAAAISSAMSLLLGAPRTLQALARDGLAPHVFGRAFGKRQDPRIATVASFLVALVGILLGDLNAIAPVLSMFFLTSYGLLNVSAGLEALIGTPSWRPKFRVHWAVSLLGAFFCFAAMFMINAGATFIAAFLAIGIYYMMKRRSLTAGWGDMRYGILMQITRLAVSKMVDSKPDEHTWQPNMLVLSGSPKTRWHLIELADAISQGRCFLTVAMIVPKSELSADRTASMTESIQQYLSKNDVSALVKVHPSEDPFTGAQDLVKAYGLGPVVPNTILLGHTEQEESFTDYAALIQVVHRTRRNLVIVREGEGSSVFGDRSRIDLWWRGKRENVGLMLSLAYLLSRDERWAKSRFILKTIVSSPDEYNEVQERTESFIKSRRLNAETEVIYSQSRDVFETIRNSSEGASLVFLGMRPPEDDEPVEEYSRYYQDLLRRTESLPSTVMVIAAETIDFHRVFESI